MAKTCSEGYYNILYVMVLIVIVILLNGNTTVRRNDTKTLCNGSLYNGLRK
jgi:hypothetical protein